LLDERHAAGEALVQEPEAQRIAEPNQQP